MISYAAALAAIADARVEFCHDQVETSLRDALGCDAARDVLATADLPPLPTAALDGFSLAGAAHFSAGDRLVVHGRTLAGEARLEGCGHAHPHAHRVMTGAAVPECTTAVLGFEDVDANDDAITLRKGAAHGSAVRARGSDVGAGQVVVRAGQRIGPGELLALAATGAASVWTRRRFSAAIIATGAEVVPHDAPAVAPEQVRDSNSPYVAARVAGAGGTVRAIEHTGDSRAALRSAIERHLDADLILTIGGVSVGDADHVAPVLAELEADVRFHRVAIRPGKPVLFATISRGGHTTHIFGMPGNPAAAAVAWSFFVEPLLRETRAGARVALRGTLEGRVRKPEGLTCFWRATAGVDRDGLLRARLHPGRESYRVLPFAQSNAWIELPPGCTEASDGAPISVWPDGPLEVWHGQES